MSGKYHNACSRCGKERVIIKTWKEKIGYSVVTTIETACPDTECQKMVEQANKKQIEKHEASKLRRKNGSTRHKKKEGK